jgi:hypothetical protein
MIRRRALLFAGVLVCAVRGCVSVQDLGSHALQDGGGALPPSPGKIFFVTSGLYTGDLASQGGAVSGLAGGDSICMTEARAAGLGGVFKAWLSTSGESAKSRIAAVGPWSAPGRPLPSFPLASVTDPPLDFLRYAADGSDLFFEAERRVWTATTAIGTLNPNGATCTGWTSRLGNVRGSHGDFLQGVAGRWTDLKDLDMKSETSPCSERLRLYCFGQ